MSDSSLQSALDVALHALTTETESPDEVAQRLRDAGCRGQRRAPNACPVQRFVVKALRTAGLMDNTVRVSVFTQSIQVSRFTSASGGVHVDQGVVAGRVMPPLILRFLLNFDERLQYSDLAVH